MKRSLRLYGIGYSEISVAVVKKLASSRPTCGKKTPEVAATAAFTPPPMAKAYG